MNEPQRKNLWTFLRAYRWRIGWVIALTGVVSIMAMLPPLFVRTLIDRVISLNQPRLLPRLGFFMLLVPALHGLCNYLQLVSVAYIGQKTVMDVRCGLYQHLLGMPMGFYSRNSTGKLVNRLMGDSTVIQSVLTVSTVQVFADLISAIFAVTVTLMLNWRLALLLAVILILFVVNYRANIGRIRTATRGYRAAEDRLAGGVQNRLTGHLTVQTYGAEDREHDVFKGQSNAALELVRESQNASYTFSMNSMLLRDVGRAVIYFTGCAMVLRDAATYGDVVAFTAYSMQLLVPAVRFSTLAQQLQNVRVSMDRLLELLAEAPTIVNPDRPKALPRARGRVDLDHVAFGYEPGKPIFEDLDLHVLPGQTVALVGPTGCGKTTILSLLLRFYDVNGGAVRIDGIDVRDMDLETLRRQFGIVLQESLLFSASVADNIRYSRPGAPLEDVEHAARLAEIHNVIAALPEGYASRLGDENVQLSVGQKQRISIARAVLADPAVLIMDEATSALDSESERAIQQALDRFLVGRTSFIVAHRLSTIRNADRIVLLDGGSIVETGNHEELMQIPGGRYREMYEKHSGQGVLAEE